MKTTKKKKPTTQKVLMPPGEPKPLSAKEGSMQAIALCHNLIAESLQPFNKHEQIKAALGYLESLFGQVKEMKDEPTAEAVTPEVVSTPTETSLELVNEQH